MKNVRIVLFMIISALLSVTFSSCKKSATACEPVVLDENPAINSIGKVDVRGATAYIAIAETLLTNNEPTAAQWDSLFLTPYYNLLITQLQQSTATKEKEDMRIVYMPSKASQLDANKSRLAHHIDYKNNLSNLKSYASMIKTADIGVKVKSFLYPFLPTYLQNEALLPPLVYTFYYDLEANGFPTGILQDLYLTSLVDSYSLGILTAHEAYHSISKGEYQKKLNPANTCKDSRLDLITMINLIAQEGIADLIDKDTLSKNGSPLKDIILAQRGVNEMETSVNMIKKLDEELKYAYQAKRIKIDFSNTNNFLINGGHIPGRIMGKAIQQYGKLQSLVSKIYNPIEFMITYNEAAKLSNGTLPVFSIESIAYLREIEKFALLP